MSNISKVEARLPPGFRFHPRDEELVCDYLMKKITHSDPALLIDVDLNKCEPWDIPETACVGAKEWCFYTQRDRKYATGVRTNRATASGYWKATGKDRPIFRKGSTLVGMRKTLVFYEGRAPKGKKTDWVMHEFRLEGPLGPSKVPSSKEDWVLCRVFYKNRELAGKTSMGSCYEDTVSSSLPPLMDSYISFDHHSQAHLDECEQVPCFSVLSAYQTNPNIFNHRNTMEPNLPAKINAATHGGGTPNFGSCLDPFDRKALKAVLDQLTRIERNPHNQQSLKGSASLGEGSSESYLPEIGMPYNIWNNY